MINFEIKYIIKTVPKRRKLYNLYVLNIFYTVTNRIIIDIKRYMYVCICMGAHRGVCAWRPQGEGVGVWVPAWGGVTVWAPAGGWGVGVRPPSPKNYFFPNIWGIFLLLFLHLGGWEMCGHIHVE